MKTIQIRLILGIMFCLGHMAVSIQPVFSIETETIGKVIAIRGKVVATGNDASSRILKLKAPVFLKDTIKTQNGRIQMMFKDNTLLTLGHNSQIQITKYLWEPGNADSAMETQMQEGSFRIMGGAITRIAPNNFKTDAPSGTIGIRGSMYAGMVKDASLFVIFQGGKGIYVQNDGGMVDITRPGFGTRVGSRQKAPEKPQKISPQELQALENSLSAAPQVTPRTSDSSNAEPESVTDETSAPETKTAADDPPPELDDTLAEASPMEEAPVSSEAPPLDSLTDMQSIINDATQDSTLNKRDEELTLDGTQKEILLLLSGLGFTETALSTAVPTDGIWKYNGEMKNTLVSEPLQEMKFIVNWHNKRIIGFEKAPPGPGSGNSGFAFGTIDTSGGISNLKVLGSGGDPGMGGAIMALTGSETFGHFYGADQGGLGIAMEGFDYNIQDQTQKVPWSDIVAATVEIPKTATAPSGSETWNGFFVGVAEDMSNPNTNRRIFYNTASTGFYISINKDTGIFSGSLFGEDFDDSNNDLGLNIGGGSNNSAFLTDTLLAATLSNATVDIGGATGGLKPHGNFMVTANEPRLSDHTTWGYWEVAYSEPGTGKDYHLHVPGAVWIAGVQSSITPSFTGTYTGKAKGVMFDNTSQMTELTNGTTNLNIDFTGITTPVMGNITFDEITLPVTTSSASDLAAAGFNATISGSITGRSSVNGAFYGPTIPGASGTGPAAVGGNFAAEMPSGIHYHGIFAGNLQP